MNNPSEELKTLAEIRDLMDRSSRFLSLSGMAGIFAGVFALTGVAIMYIHYGVSFSTIELLRDALVANNESVSEFYGFMILNGILVLAASLAGGFYFSARKAASRGFKMWDSTAKRMAANFFIPLAAGGIFCLALLMHHYISFVVPATLIFYGLALINASKYTLGEVRYLGICEIVLGLASSFFLGSGLIFRALGFGVLHIVYGWRMYIKYDTKTAEE